MTASCDGVVLAAGLSRRAGAFKPGLPLGGMPLIRHTVEGMAGVVARVVVVVGWRAERVRELLAPCPGVEFATNDAYREGMFSSVRAGIARVRAPRFFLLPGDIPLVRRETYEALRDADAPVVIPTHGGRRGHPVLMDSALIPAILARPPDSTLRDFIEAQGYVTVEVPDRGILLDADTPEDLAALEELLNARRRAPGGV